MLVKSVTALLATGLAPLLASAQYRITGAPSPASDYVPARRNVNDLYSEGGPSWDLYIQALSEFQASNVTKVDGYFQIAGIHGKPYIEWANGGADTGENGWKGYCPHGEALFLPWHRPYVLLFEQVLVRSAIDIASKYPAAHRDKYMAAARSLRSPYWDWSADSNLPPCTVPPTVSVNIPDGQNLKRVQMENPLSTYEYPIEARDGRFGAFSSQRRMARCPSPQRYPDSANRRLQFFGLKQATYDIFTTAASFREFAVGGRFHSVEELHNDIHLAATCRGDFSDLALSGFEPLFMLHHTHVDRLWAYWQFIEPALANFNGSYSGQSRFSTPQGTIITPESPLPPFFDRNLRPFTSKSVSSMQGMGYTYEGLEYWRYSPEELRRRATRIINSLYAPSSAFVQRKRGDSQTNTRHFAQVELDRAQVERPCSVNIFIDGKPAGIVPVMAFPANGILRSTVSIDGFLNDSSSNATLASMESMIEVQITKNDGTAIPVKEVKSLNITLEQASITPAASRDEFPTLAETKQHAAKILPFASS